MEKFKKAQKAQFVKMLPNLELGMTFLLAYEKIRKEMKEIEERGELQQHQVPEDSLPKVNKAKSERHKFVRLPYPSSVRMMYQNICKNCVKLKKLLKTKKKHLKIEDSFLHCTIAGLRRFRIL